MGGLAVSSQVVRTSPRLVTGEELFVYLDCPLDHEPLKIPFMRQSGPVPWVHYRNRIPTCRLVIVPDPFGEDHRRIVVPRRVSMEEVLEREWRLWIDKLNL